MDRDLDLSPLHRHQLALAKELQAVCCKHQIAYFLIAGTLLGAVRHKGFIPWDDDLDIGMLREDYDRFLAIAQEELVHDFFLQSYLSDVNMPLPYTKLRANHTVIRERKSFCPGSHNGVFIDIFPFDGIPNNRYLQQVRGISLKLLGLVLMVKCNFTPTWHTGKTIKRFLYYSVIKAISSTFRKSWLTFLYEKIVRATPANSAGLVAACKPYHYPSLIHIFNAHKVGTSIWFPCTATI